MILAQRAINRMIKHNRKLNAPILRQVQVYKLQGNSGVVENLGLRPRFSVAPSGPCKCQCMKKKRFDPYKNATKNDFQIVPSFRPRGSYALMNCTVEVFGFQREYDVEMTSMQLHYVASTSVRRHFNAMCLLEWVLACTFCKNAIKMTRKLKENQIFISILILQEPQVTAKRACAD